MSRVLSFRDLRLITELSQYSEFELLDPRMDDRVNYYLKRLGFDLDYGVVYVPNKHRDMQGNVGIGFRVVGEASINRRFINSPLCSLTERLIAAAYQDVSRARELAYLLGSRIYYRDTDDDYEDTSEEDFPADLIEPDCEAVMDQIKVLELMRDSIRGPYLNEAGAVKTPGEYK